MSIETSIANVIRTREPRSLLTRVALPRRSCGTNAAPKISLAIRTKMAKSKMTRPRPEAKTGKRHSYPRCVRHENSTGLVSSVFSHRSQLLIEASGVLASCNGLPPHSVLQLRVLALDDSKNRLSNDLRIGSIPEILI